MFLWTVSVLMACGWYSSLIVTGIRSKLAPLPLFSILVCLSWEIGASSKILRTWGIQEYLEPVWLVAELVMVWLFVRYGPKDYPGVRRTAIYLGTGIALVAVTPGVTFLLKVMDDPMGLYLGFPVMTLTPIQQIFTLHRRRSSAGQTVFGAACLLMAGLTAGAQMLIDPPFTSNQAVFVYTAVVMNFSLALHLGLLVWTRRREALHNSVTAVPFLTRICAGVPMAMGGRERSEGRPDVGLLPATRFKTGVARGSAALRRPRGATRR
ncbi:hypothetical protein AB0I49_16215 [Streptomyces sp. NPDC050617]|uniref:hypothetical protein n=1 Tax=Streptomyces sp. NPDC050617 TaxID=3154628 RepID=UPI003427295A